MRGFKSSGPRSIVVNFEKGFTVITGPNGSGKSNIADAVLFALGENSPKQLRAANGRLTGLIYDPHKGDEAPAAERPNLCRVTVQFDNADRAVPVDSDLVTVTRELRSDGENFYYLNGKKTTRGGLMEILDLATLSPGGLNIVAQGAATRVADQTPEEKRRMIEEVVGIAKFDERKAEAQRQLSQADQRLEVAMARIGEMKNTLEGFDSQRNDMVRFNMLEGQINWLTAVRTSKRIGELRERVSSLRALEADLNARLQELQARLADYENKVVQVENEKSRFVTEVIQGGGSGYVELQFQLAEVTDELDGLQSDLKTAEENVSQLEGETIPQLKQNVGAKQKEVNASNTVVRQLTADQERLDGKRRELAGRLKDLLDAGAELRETIEKKTKETSRVQLKLADLGGKQTQVEMLINGLEASLNAERKRLDELKVRVDGYSQTLSQLDANTKKLYALHDESTKELNAIDGDLSAREATRARLLDSIEAATRTLDKASAEVSREAAFQQVSESIAGERTGQLKLQEFCDSGGVSGYVGRLSQLVRYQPAYAKAVGAVFGRWTGAFVVEDLHSMTQLIKAAKSLKAKTFSVIPLSEVENSVALEVDKSAGVVGPLSEVVKCDPKFNGLVNFLAGDAVVVESEAIGYILASEGVKAVTLTGEIFERGGKAFSFGYQELLLNLMEGLENLEGTGEIEDAVGALKGAINRRKNELESVESSSRSLSKERVKKIASVAGLKAEAASFTRISNRYTTIFKSMNTEYEKQARAVERLEARLASAIAKRDSMVKGAASLRAVVANTQSLGLEPMLSELDAAKQSVSSEIDAVRNRIAEIYLSLTTERGNLESVLVRALEDNILDLQNAEEDLRSNKEFCRDAPKRIRDGSAQKAELEAQIEKLKESSRKSQPVLDEFDSRARRAREERDSAQRSIIAAQKETLTLSAQIQSNVERVEEALGSLRMLGYSEEPEIFESSETLLAELQREYDEVSRAVNRGADRQYKEMYTNYKNLSVRHNELEKERNAIIGFIESVESEKRAVFMTAYEKISSEFKVIFHRLTGGEAWLDLEKPDEIFAGGLLLMARFGTKPAWESLSLSGGEKSVSGVALILAMQSVHPAPFYLFDEIDAALDAVNSSNLAEFLREKSSGAQMVVITLRDVFVAQSNITYGIYAAGGVSRVVHYKPAEVPVNRG